MRVWLRGFGRGRDVLWLVMVWRLLYRGDFSVSFVVKGLALCFFGCWFV